MVYSVIVNATILLLALCTINLNPTNAIPNSKNGQWSVNSNLNSRESRDSKDKESDEKRKLTATESPQTLDRDHVIIVTFIIRMLSCNI